MGGPGNPPDKTGYRVIILSPDPDEASRVLTGLRDEGWEVVASYYEDRVILSNYKGH
jgi:hypothetical protein